MNVRLTLAQKGLILVGIPILVEFGVLSLLIKLQYDTEKQEKKEAHCRQILATSGQFAQHVWQISRNMNLLRDKDGSFDEDRVRDFFLRTYSDILELEAITDQTPYEARMIDSISQNSRLAKRIALSCDERIKAGEPPLIVWIKARGKLQTITDNCEQALFNLAAAAKKEQTETPAAQEAYRKQVLMLVLLQVGLSTFVAVGLCLHFNRTTVKRLAVVMDNTVRLRTKQPLNPRVGGTDEIAELDKVFNDMAAALKESEEKRAAIEKMKQEFLQMVSHDLRTPLTSVRAALTILATGCHGALNDNGQQTIEDAEANVDRLINLINDLLDIEKMEQGKLELEINEAPVADMVSSAVSAVKGFARQQDVTLTENVDEELYVLADSDRIVQVLVNLLSNAIKFSRSSGAVTIRVSSFAPGQVQFAVIDQGRGIAPQDQDRIFNRFEQTSIDDAKKHGGSGLGLSICKAIIEQHGGIIGLESELGKGTTFWFRLPSVGQQMRAATTAAPEQIQTA